MNIFKLYLLSLYAPSFVKYIHKVGRINHVFEKICKEHGFDDVKTEAIKKEAQQLSINTVHTYEYCLAYLLKKQIEEESNKNDHHD